MIANLVSASASPVNGQKAATLARRFERANDTLIAAVERCPDAAWWGAGPAMGWPAETEARRCAEEFPVLAGFIAAVATGRPLPPLRDECLDPTERRAGQGAAGSRDDALGSLRSNGAAAASIIRGLSDEQLDRSTSYFGTKLSAAQLVDELLLAHIDEHRSGIQA